MGMLTASGVMLLCGSATSRLFPTLLHSRCGACHTQAGKQSHRKRAKQVAASTSAGYMFGSYPARQQAQTLQVQLRKECKGYSRPNSQQSLNKPLLSPVVASEHPRTSPTASFSLLSSTHASAHKFPNSQTTRPSKSELLRSNFFLQVKPAPIISATDCILILNTPNTLGYFGSRLHDGLARFQPLINHKKLLICQASSTLSYVTPMEETSGFEVRDSIELTELESKIFDTLMGTVRHFALKTQLRVAGGWVRDKLIGKESHDIDIALDDCMGEDFATKVNEYLQLQNMETHQVGVIKSNPDQSKHLETATMRVHGLWIDLVNLRAETYAENSRIPKMEFGSAEDDALRRDLTINSLFYNINTGEVEDFTGKGISDLREGVIRTPLPPVRTFLDDPLRVLRSVRFAARFQFQIVEELQAAAQRSEVRSALASKVSRERIGKEVELMLGGSSPLLAMRHLAAFQLFPTIFALPEGATPAITHDYGSRCVASLAEVVHVMDLCQLSLPQPPTEGGSSEVQHAENEDRICTLLAGLLLPLRKTVTYDKKKKAVPVSTYIVRESLKQKASYADTLMALHSGANEMHAVVPELLNWGGGSVGTTGPPGSEGEASDGSPGLALEAQRRVAVGILIRRLKRLWRPALLLSTVLDHPSTFPIGGDEELAQSEAATRADEEGSESSVKRKRAMSRADKCVEFQAVVAGLGLERAWEIKPLLDGKSIIKALNFGGGGPRVGKWVDKAMEWQLANPQASMEDCRAWLQAEYAKTGGATGC